MSEIYQSYDIKTINMLLTHNKRYDARGWDDFINDGMAVPARGFKYFIHHLTKEFEAVRNAGTSDLMEGPTLSMTRFGQMLGKHSDVISLQEWGEILKTAITNRCEAITIMLVDRNLADVFHAQYSPQALGLSYAEHPIIATLENRASSTLYGDVDRQGQSSNITQFSL